MNALVILLVLILAFLGLFFNLLKKYFHMRKSIKRLLQNVQNQTNKRAELLIKSSDQMELENQFHSQIDKRLLELEQKFPNTTNETDLSNQNTETLTKNFKKLVRSTLKLLKAEHSYYTNR